MSVQAGPKALTIGFKVVALARHPGDQQQRFSQKLRFPTPGFGLQLLPWLTLFSVCVSPSFAESKQDRVRNRRIQCSNRLVLTLFLIIIHRWGWTFVKSQKDPSSLGHPKGLDLSQILKAVPPRRQRVFQFRFSFLLKSSQAEKFFH